MSKMIRWMIAITAVLALWGSPAFGQEPKAPTLEAANKQAIVDEISALLNKNYIFAETDPDPAKERRLRQVFRCSGVRPGRLSRPGLGQQG